MNIFRRSELLPICMYIYMYVYIYTYIYIYSVTIRYIYIYIYRIVTLTLKPQVITALFECSKAKTKVIKTANQNKGKYT